LADLSVNYVERFALHCGFAIEKISQDYGLDLAIFTFDPLGCLEPGVLWVQLKATDHLKLRRGSKHALIRLDRRDILAWIADANPVFLVLYDAVGDCAYWLSIQTYFSDEHAFAKLRGKTVTVYIPKANVLSVDAMREFAQEKAALRTPSRGQP